MDSHALSQPPSFVLQGEGDAGEYRIALAPRDAPYVLHVGRAPDNNVTLRNRSVSAHHAHIEVGGRHDYHVTVRDHGADGTGSRFGTLVGETHLKGSAVRVGVGDPVCFGTTKYGAHFHLEDNSNPLPPGGLHPNHNQNNFLNQQPEEYKDDLKKGGSSGNNDGPMFFKPGGRPVQVQVPPSGLGQDNTNNNNNNNNNNNSSSSDIGGGYGGGYGRPPRGRRRPSPRPRTLARSSRRRRCRSSSSNSRAARCRTADRSSGRNRRSSTTTTAAAATTTTAVA